MSVWTATGKYLRAFGAVGQGAGQFSSAGGMTFDTLGRLVIGDTGRLTLFSANGGAAGTIEFDGGSDSGRDVALGPDGLLYVADPPQVKVYEPGGNFLGFFGDRGEAPGPFFANNTSLAFGGSTLYVSDSGLSRVQAFGSRGQFVGPVGLTPGSQPAQFTEPTALATDCRGTLYVADFGNARVQRFGDVGPTRPPPCGSVTSDPAERFTATLGGAKIQEFREEFAVRPAVSCGRPCYAIISGRVRVAGSRRTIPVDTDRRSLEFPGLAVVNLAPSERGTDQIISALRRKKRVTATIRFTGRDLTGRVSTKTRSYRLR